MWKWQLLWLLLLLMVVLVLLVGVDPGVVVGKSGVAAKGAVASLVQVEWGRGCKQRSGGQGRGLLHRVHWPVGCWWLLLIVLI